MGKYGQTKYGQTKYGFTIEYIFDRTEMDLIKGTAKAYINYEDLNRIEKGIKAISKKYGISAVSKTDWKCQFSGDTVDNFPLKVHMEQILSNLKKIISVTGYESSENIPSSFDKMDIYKMNNIEKIINDLELL